MRLPSHSYDKNDLARSLSVAAECPEEVMEAEEYLQPTPRHSMEQPTTPVSSKVIIYPTTPQHSLEQPATPVSSKVIIMVLC